MTTSNDALPANSPRQTNGSGAAAILSAGIGCFVLAVLAIAGDKSALFKTSLIFYKPTGPLSGVSTAAIFIWLLAWGILERRWRKSTVAMGQINAAAITLLGLSLLLTFPPFAELF